MEFPDKTVVQTSLRSDTLSAGTLISGRYRIERVLGQGGMGVVYLAFHLALKRPVALKMLLPHLADRAEFVARFHREAEALARLRHPHIVAVTDFGDDNGRCFLVFEYIDGGTLEAVFLDRGTTFSNQEVARILTEILEGLSHAHASGIIHRDLKPANILIEKTGEAKISDFGLARVIGDDAHRALVAQTQSSIAAGSDATSGYAGTADFMAPEVKLLRPADERSDLYAVGVMAYWLLTGRRPSAMSTAVSRAAGRRNLGKAWDRMIAAALAEDPAQRYPSADAMLAAVRTVATARPPSRAVPLSVGFVAVAAALAGLAWWQPWRSAEADAREPAATQVVATTRELVLRGAPEDAEISIAGGPFRPLAPVQALVGVPSSGAELVVRAPRFVAWQGRAGGPNDPATIDLQLEPSPPRLIAFTGLPAGAEVEIGGERTIVDASGVVSRSLHPGPVTVQATARKYQPLQRVIEITDGQDSVPLALERIPPPREVSLPLAEGVALVLRRVEPGEFPAGSPLQEVGRQPSDEPVRPARIEQPFYLGVFEVNQAEYLALMQTNPSASRSLRDVQRPVEQVGWLSLRAPDGFLARANERLKQAGLPYVADLPTEREWEYACRAGTRTALHDGRDLTQPLADPALDRLAVYRQIGHAPERVGARAANAWGFHDMHGNVAEWTRDAPVLRGGNWRVGAAHCRSASRIVTAADARPNDTMGFRLVLRPTDE